MIIRKRGVVDCTNCIIIFRQILMMVAIIKIIGFDFGVMFRCFFKNYGLGMIIGILGGLTIGTLIDASYKRKG